ncbi:MAG TPA: hypothetical protein VFS40_11610 [Gemmatimonadales bacterium]|nr:hypothetical protein [Gemmatimonadales bacterium]
MPTTPLSRALAVAALAVALGCAPARTEAQSASAAAPERDARAADATHLLNVAALSGQQVPVVPVGMVSTDPALLAASPADSAAKAALAPWRDRRAAQLLADSLVGDALEERAPEVQWILPPRLRRVAKRAPGIVADPDRMGQAALRSPGLKTVPDPLASSLRNLVALTGGRLVLVPAAVAFAPDSAAGVRATLALALADARSTNVLWRSQASGAGATPAEALRAALAAVLPSDSATP